MSGLAARLLRCSLCRPSLAQRIPSRTCRQPWRQLSRHLSTSRRPASSRASTHASLGTSSQPSMPLQTPNATSRFFEDISHLIPNNDPELRYGVCATDVDNDGQVEFFVCGFGSKNRLLKWDAASGALVDSALSEGIEDEQRLAIGVAAGDLDGDGTEELYVLNTDTFGGRKRFGDRVFDLQQGGWVDLFSLPQNQDDANSFAGRSVCAVDRFGNGKYGFFVANYGGPMKLFELVEGGFLSDVAREAGLVTYPTGGRALVSLPLVSQAHMDIFAGNEGGPNFLFANKGDGSGQFQEMGAQYGLQDPRQHCRGVAVLDPDGEGDLGLCTGNWEGYHRLFRKSGPGPKGGAAALGFADVSEDVGGFSDMAPPEMAEPSRVRTVIAADLDNDGWEELFFNNIGSRNRLFRQVSAGKWEEVPLGEEALPQGLGTGAAVADIDSDGVLELLIAHGESGKQPMSLLKCTSPEVKANSWMRVQPLTQQGAPARGATVSLKDEQGRWQKRAIDAGSGYLCCMEPVAHFGLGRLEGPVDLKVTWPDGSVKGLSGIRTRQVLRVPHP